MEISYSRFDRHEEADCECLVLVGEGDHHELPARPDVQVVRRHRELEQMEEGVANRLDRVTTLDSNNLDLECSVNMPGQLG